MSARLTSVPLPPTFAAATVPDTLSLPSSPLRPKCSAQERIFRWRGVNTPPASTIANPIIRHLDDLASHASLRDGTLAGYGTALRKFMLFCTIFSIPEADRLPASFPLLKSFVLWASTDPDPNDPILAGGTPFEPVSVTTARRYLAGIRAWHIAQGFPPPLSDTDLSSIGWTLRGLDQLQGTRRRRPPRPPVTLRLLALLKSTLRIDEPFDACVWAAASCSFWGMMRFGEVSVSSRTSFDGAKHLKRCDVFVGHDLDQRLYARLDLPLAKTAKPGETQQVFVTRQGELCAIAALRNLSSIVPAGPQDPLFSWRDCHGNIRPLVRDAALTRINDVFQSLNVGTTFGHSFRIGGASFYLAQKVDPEIVRISGRWKSLAYQTYIRAFEQIASRHLAGLEQRAVAGHQ
ncbi:hypothetical protein BXZ70DRAFT_887055 [Cristinia sonorae]|uniref:DNA breaking-rejoining enzyme n=1 Tax=Cristinia sonorae TaxID=1940300 RepID=A0A8K0UVG7_9AGAR|nr:hypothetical protein BXZ70DRAFT_887055 [Cristinia sonorae]